MQGLEAQNRGTQTSRIDQPDVEQQSAFQSHTDEGEDKHPFACFIIVALNSVRLNEENGIESSRVTNLRGQKVSPEDKQRLTTKSIPTAICVAFVKRSLKGVSMPTSSVLRRKEIAATNTYAQTTIIPNATSSRIAAHVDTPVASTHHIHIHSTVRTLTMAVFSNTVSIATSRLIAKAVIRNQKKRAFNPRIKKEKYICAARHRQR